MQNSTLSIMASPQLVKISDANSENSYAIMRYFMPQNIKYRMRAKFIKSLRPEADIEIRPENEEILLEDLDGFLKYLFNSKIISFLEYNNYLNIGYLNFNTTPSYALLMQGKNLKFTVKIEDQLLALRPVSTVGFKKILDLQYFVRQFYNAMNDSVEDFMQYNIRFTNHQVQLEFHNVVDQLFYILKRFFRSPDVFANTARSKDALVQVSSHITSSIAQAELMTLSTIVEANDDHILSQYRYLGLRSHQLFNKIAQHGRVDLLEDEDIALLHDAFTFEGVFDSMPPIILRAFNKLKKILPFRQLENIVLLRKRGEYVF